MSRVITMQQFCWKKPQREALENHMTEFQAAKWTKMNSKNRMHIKRWTWKHSKMQWEIKGVTQTLERGKNWQWWGANLSPRASLASHFWLELKSWCYWLSSASGSICFSKYRNIAVVGFSMGRFFENDFQFLNETCVSQKWIETQKMKFDDHLKNSQIQ